MIKIFPKKLEKGDEVRIIVLSTSLSVVSEENRKIANKRLEDLGLRVSFGKHVNEVDEFLSASIESRIEDLHEAFLDKNVKAVLTVLGGYNANQILKYIDWDIIKNNPKIFCGYSDITILNNSFYVKTGLVNYYGPHYSTFGQKLHFDYTLDYFKKCLFEEDPYFIKSSDAWSDDKWYKDQENRVLIPNEGHIV
ncbi:MAG: LD-carboxypeptidase, partial [Candidatus Pacebacteria bacterium]|nr:LD-carboxypeptidase [Candidatus Paceibacterota bacterium]